MIDDEPEYSNIHGFLFSTFLHTSSFDFLGLLLSSLSSNPSNKELPPGIPRGGVRKPVDLVGYNVLKTSLDDRGDDGALRDGCLPDKEGIGSISMSYKEQEKLLST